MKFKKFQARNVPVLNFSYTADLHGDTFPPECHVEFKNPVPVIYDFKYEMPIGKAYLMRVGNQILADIIISSPLDDTEEAENLIKRMYPAVGGYIKQRVGKALMHIEICAISVSNNKNIDPNIEWLGNRVRRVRKPTP